MSIKEIARTIADFRQEFRTGIAQLVRTDVYRAEQSAFDARVKRIEEDKARDESEKDSFRRLVYGALITAGGSLLVTIVTALIAARG